MFDRDQVEKLEQVEQLLDAWEASCEQNPQPDIDTFLDQAGSRFHHQVIADFRQKAAQLAKLGRRLGAIADLSRSPAYTQSEGAAASLSPNDLQTGLEPITGYRLTARLGAGGFGEVWKAQGPGGFQVALKFVPADHHAGAIEIRSLALMRDVRHPHLLSIFGAWRVGKLLVIASELAECTLLDRFTEARQQGQAGIPPDELLRYLEDAAKGIDFLNEPNAPGRCPIQHRDIKPQNLLLLGGSVKVGDFGLVRPLHQDVTGHSGSLTLAYAAPECLEGSTTAQSDQYSLAVTYCSLRSGRFPFEGTVAQILEGHRKGTPNLAMLPEAERSVVAKALSKNPEGRWTNCLEFVRALRSPSSAKFVEQHDPWPITIRNSRRAPSKRLRVAASVVIALASTALATVMVFVVLNSKDQYHLSLKSSPATARESKNSHVKPMKKVALPRTDPFTQSSELIGGHQEPSATLRDRPAKPGGEEPGQAGLPVAQLQEYSPSARDRILLPRTTAIIGRTDYGTRYHHVEASSALLIGFEISYGKYGKNYEFTAVGSVTPIFRTEMGEKMAPVFGKRRGATERIAAPLGHAVSGMRVHVNSGTRVVGLQLNFGRVVDGKVDMTQEIVSKWKGVPLESAPLITGDGSPIVGVTGYWAKESLRAIGLDLAPIVAPGQPASGEQ